MGQRTVLVIDHTGRSIPLRRGGDITIGRDSSNDVVLDSPTVSRRHARLRSTADGWLVTDEGSSNGTFVDEGPAVTSAGDAVGVGSRLRFGAVTAEIRSATQAMRPPLGATPTGPKVFVSYSRQDAREVDRLAADLERRGIAAWVDRSGLVGSADWTTEIVEAIEQADGFVVALSRRSIESDDVANELHLAGARNVPMFPVLLEAVSVPENFQYYLAGRQHYDLAGDNRRFEIDRLVTAITSPRVRHRRQLSAGRRLAVATIVILLLVGIPAAILSFLTGSVPPDLGRITGSRACDGLDVALTTEDVTTFVDTKTAHLAISLVNTSDTAVDLGSWSVGLTSGGGSGEPYRFIENEGVEDRALDPGERTVGRVAVRGSFAPSDGDEPVRLEVSGVEQGNSVFARCRATTQGVISWG